MRETHPRDARRGLRFRYYYFRYARAYYHVATFVLD